MNNLPRELRRVLRADPILSAVLGEDQDHEIKVYTPMAKSSVEAPYVTFQIVPTQGPIAVYGDTEVIEAFQVSVSVWAKSNIEAWSLADIADDAMKRGDYGFEPYQLMFVNRISTPRDLVDRDTGLYYLVVLYQFALGR